MPINLPSSILTGGRFPDSAKYWVDTYDNLNDGEIYEGMHRWTRDLGLEYVLQKNGTWKLAAGGEKGKSATISIGNVVSGNTASVTNVGTENDAILNIVLPKGDTGGFPIVDIGEVSTGITPSVQNVGTSDRVILNFVLPKGLDGASVWMCFADSINGDNPSYDPTNKSFISFLQASILPEKASFTNWTQIKSQDGKSVWIAYSPYSNGSGATYTLNSTHKFISFLTSEVRPSINSFSTWVRFVGLDGGPAGASAYETWLELGNSGTEEEFINSLRGNNGESAYQTWLELGNTGTKQDFIDSLGTQASVTPATSSHLGGVKIGTNIDVTLDGTISVNLNTINQSISTLKSSITGRYIDGHVEAFTTAQLAADALYSAGGGTIYSENDIIGPLQLRGSVSLIAPGKKIYTDPSSSSDVLSLLNHTGVVELGEVIKTSGIWAYAIKVTGGSSTIKTNITCSRGYNALFLNGGATTFEGNVAFSNDISGPAGERIAVLGVSATLKMVGDITVASSDTATEGLTSFSGSNIDYTGTIKVLSKGSLGRTQSGYLSLRGRGISADRGFRWFLGKADVYMSIDTRTSSNPTGANSAFTMQVNSGATGTEFLTLHSGCELLVPTTIPSIFSVSAQSLVVKTTASIVQTSLPDNALIIQQIGVGGTVDKGYVDSADNALQVQINALSGGSSASSPLTPDTEIWLDAANAFATNKGRAGAFQVNNGTTFRTNPTGLNGLPTVLLNNSSAGNLDPSLVLYGNNFVKSGPGTFTILCKCTSSVNSDLTNVDGKRLLQYDFDADFALNYQSFVTNSSAGASVNVGSAWTVVTIQFPSVGNGFVYVNGLYYTVTGDRNYMFGAGYGGHIRLLGSFVGEIAEVLVSRDASREAGRLHEQYLKTKYNLTF